MSTDQLDRKPDTVVFTVTESERDHVVSLSDRTIKVEEREGDRLLTEVALYAEGELVASYLRGDDLEDGDAILVAAAAELAGMYLEYRHGTLAVPGDN